MLTEALVFFIENFIFWGFVYIIVFMGCETPAIVFSGFGLFLFYWLFRLVASKDGWERILWIHVVNMIVCIMLLFYFLTGASMQRSIRSALNSAARNVPGLEPYVKRC
jgi:hypothetical protein